MSRGLALAAVALITALAGQSEGAGEPQSALEIIRTESYEVHLSPVGGLPVRWDIMTPESADGGADRQDDGVRDPTIGLFVPKLLDSTLPRPLEIVLPEASSLNKALHRTERFEEGDDTVVRFLSPTTAAGLRWIRTYRIPRRGFEAELSVTLINDGSTALRFDDQGAGIGLRLGPGLGVELDSSGGLGGGIYTYVRPVYRTTRDVETPSLTEDEPDQAFGGADDGIDWGGIHSRYFAAILAPMPEAGEGGGFQEGRAWLPSQLTGGAALGGEPTWHPLIELRSKTFSISPGQSVELGYRFFFGPKDRRILKSTELGLDDILFPGLWNWLRWLCFILMSMLSGFHAVLQSWGLSIIALAVAIRVITFPVSQFGLKQQAAMAADQARLKPHIAAINEKYKDDATRRSKELMRLYDEHGVSPFAAFKGCLWVLIQLPIFVALFNLLGQAYELRGASFLWLRDLSEPDRLFPLGVDLPLLGGYFNLLPILMAVTQVVVNKLSTVSADPSEGATQNKFMVAMAIVFMFLFYSFPSGLVLYWTMANVGHLLQHRLMIWQQNR